MQCPGTARGRSIEPQIDFTKWPQLSHAVGAIGLYKGDAHVLGDRKMELGITILAQIALLSVVCATPILAFGVKLAPVPAKSSYVRKGIGER